MPKLPKRIAKEHPHILQKSEGPLDFGFLSLFGGFLGVEEVVSSLTPISIKNARVVVTTRVVVL